MFDNYPPGAAKDPNAPYNQHDDENEEVEVDVFVSTTLSKSTKLWTTDYTKEGWDDYEQDDIDGTVHHYGGVDYDFSDTNFTSIYHDQEYDIADLLNVLDNYIEEDLERYKGNKRKELELNHIRDCLRGWTIDDLEVMEDK